MAALVVAWPATAHAHDPGLSSLELRVEPVRVVATLSLAAADARIAAAGQRGGLESFARDAIELRFDGVMLEEVIGSRRRSATRARGSCSRSPSRGHA